MISDPRAFEAAVRQAAAPLVEQARLEMEAKLQQQLASIQGYLQTQITNVPAPNLAAPGPIGGTTPAAIDGTTITAHTQFTGSGAGLTNVPVGAISAALGSPGLSGNVAPNAITGTVLTANARLISPNAGPDAAHLNSLPAISGDTFAVLGNLPPLVFGGTVDMTGNAAVYLGGDGLVFTSQAASTGMPPGAQTRAVSNCCIVLDTVDTAANIFAELWYSADGASWSIVGNSTSALLNANGRSINAALSGTAFLPPGYIYQVRLHPSQAASATHKVLVSYY